MTEVVLARHGETEWSRNGKHTGRTDIALTRAGEEQARDLGRRLAGSSFSLVLTSRRQRAIDTCDLAGFGDVAQVREDLAEWDYGDYEGVTTADIHRTDPGWDIWRDGAPGGERPGGVGVRARRIIEELRAASGPVLVVSHGHLLRVLAACWIGLAPEDGGRFGPPSTASIGRLGDDRTTPVILSWSCAA